MPSPYGQTSHFRVLHLAVTILLEYQSQIENKMEEIADRRQKGKRCGSKNYTKQDVTALLDINAEQLLFEAKMWARVGTDLNNWATAHLRQNRKTPSLKSKLGSIKSTKKPIGDQTYPPVVDPAK